MNLQLLQNHTEPINHSKGSGRQYFSRNAECQGLMGCVRLGGANPTTARHGYKLFMSGFSIIISKISQIGKIETLGNCEEPEACAATISQKKNLKVVDSTRLPSSFTPYDWRLYN